MRAARVLSLLTLLVSLTGVTPTLLAQDDDEPYPADRRQPRGSNPQLREVSPAYRTGFWGQLGLGVGSEAFRVPSSSPYYSTTLEKPTLTAALGGTINQHFRLGVEFFGWFNEEGDVLENLTSIMAVGRLYPFRDAGLFVKGGGGVARFGQDLSGCCSQGDVGFGYTLGAGYEFRVSRNVALAPTVDLVRASFSGRTFPTYHERVVSFGLNIVVQSNH